MTYLQEYGTLLIFVGLAIGIPILLLGISFAGKFIKARPESSNETKRDAYESGFAPMSKKPSRVNFRYYYFALLFVAFDVETVLLYPVAANYGVISREFGIGALVALFIFLIIVTVPFLYAWARNTLEWE